VVHTSQKPCKIKVFGFFFVQPDQPKTMDFEIDPWLFPAIKIGLHPFFMRQKPKQTIKIGPARTGHLKGRPGRQTSPDTEP
jgi:hypothetical protein